MRKVQWRNMLRRAAGLWLADGTVCRAGRGTIWEVGFTNTDKPMVDFMHKVLSRYGHVSTSFISGRWAEQTISCRRQRGGTKKRKNKWNVRLSRNSSVERFLTAIRPWLLGKKGGRAVGVIDNIRKQRRAA